MARHRLLDLYSQIQPLRLQHCVMARSARNCILKFFFVVALISLVANISDGADFFLPEVPNAAGVTIAIKCPEIKNEFAKADAIRIECYFETFPANGKSEILTFTKSTIFTQSKKRISDLSNLICNCTIEHLIKMPTDDLKIDGGTTFRIDLIQQKKTICSFVVIGGYISLKTHLIVIKDITQELLGIINDVQASQSPKK